MPFLAGLAASLMTLFRKLFLSKNGIFGWLAVIGLNVVTWGGLTLLVDEIASHLSVTTFPPGSVGNFTMNFILMCGLSDYASIVLGALSIKMVLAASKIRLGKGQLPLPF